MCSIIIIQLNLDCIFSDDAELKQTCYKQVETARSSPGYSIYSRVEVGAHLSEFLVNSGK